jgi:hypothetical protein
MITARAKRSRIVDLGLALGLALPLACTRAPEPEGPIPLSVSPAQGSGLAPLAVEIAGSGFEARVRADFDEPSGDELNAQFTVTMEPMPGGAAVQLEGVTLTSRRTLRATVPAGLALGLYRLSVTDPRGRSGVLEQAFRVVIPAENVASFRVEVLEPPRAGIAFPVSITAVDAGGSTVDGFVSTVTLADSTGTLSPASAGPFALGRFQGTVVVQALAVGDQLTATDADGRSGSSAPFDVVAGPPVAVVFPGLPVTASAGACSPVVNLELRDAVGHPTPAEADLPVQLQSAPPGLSFFSDASCSSPASLSFPAGNSHASFHFQGGTAGSVIVRVVPATLPSAAQTETISP